MGGRVAEELIFGKEEITGGASADFANATQLAEKMVKEFGYSEKIGPISVKYVKNLSTDTSHLIEQEIKNFLSVNFIIILLLFLLLFYDIILLGCLKWAFFFSLVCKTGSK